MGDVGVSDWLLGSLVRATAERLCLFATLFFSKSILHILQQSQSIPHNYLLRIHSDNNSNTTKPSQLMDPPPKFASPGTPLFPLSPERVNGRPPYNGHLSTSTSHPEFGKPSLTANMGPADPFIFNPSSPKSPSKHSRNNSSTSDALVQGMVARFDGLTVRDYKASSELAVKRAEMAREMAELERDKLKWEMGVREEEIRKTKEEGRKLRKDVEDGRERERKVARRVDVLKVSRHVNYVCDFPS